MEEQLVVATTILEQLGGRRFVLMTGAKDLVGSEDTLAFRLPSNFAKGGINRVTVTLDPSDTYTMRFYRGAVLVSELDDIYNDMLQSVFASQTGLHTRL